MSRPLILFTDLDGTLLDHHSYSFAAASEAIGRLNDLDIPWILNSSKTLAELRILRSALKQRHPVIVENGAGIAIPVGYSHKLWSGVSVDMDEQDGFLLQALGRPRDEMLQLLQPLRDEFNYRGFSDMSVDELCGLTGLDSASAEQALIRHFSEPILWQDSETKLEAFAAHLRCFDLALLRGGRFIHVMGSADKGRAMAWLLDGYSHAGTVPTTVALGDSHNDLAMLRAADIAVVVTSPVHAPPELPGHQNLIVTQQDGPAGWNSAVLGILKSGDA